MTAHDLHRLRGEYFRRLEQAPDLLDADIAALIYGDVDGVDDDDLVTAMLTWEELHPRLGISLTGPRWETCQRGPRGCYRCRVTALWERASRSCIPCKGRGVIDSYTVEDGTGRDVDVDVPCPDCQGTGQR